MTWVKICGITNLLDAQMAVSLGADALGFIFAPSKRQVDPQTVQKIVSRLPPYTEKIGVFMDMEEQQVVKIARFCGLSGLQFHGRETPTYCKKFAGFQVIKAFRVNAQRGWDEILPYIQCNAVDRILLDTYVEGIPGGTGKTFPWKLVASFDWGNIPVVIAGGINPENVMRAICEATPFGVDVGSGVEREAGKKDHNKLVELMQEIKAHNADEYNAGKSSKVFVQGVKQEREV
ncbi:MAG: phosphoribosylanthranilate isomerase [Bacillota bacterium]